MTAPFRSRPPSRVPSAANNPVSPSYDGFSSGRSVRSDGSVGVDVSGVFLPSPLPSLENREPPWAALSRTMFVCEVETLFFGMFVLLFVGKR